MGSIPRYQRQKLASSVVGTAGADLSAAMVTETISTGLGNVANTLFELQASRKQIVNETEATNKFNEYDIALNKNIQDIKTGQGNNPDEAVKLINKEAVRLSQDFSKTLNNTASQNIFQKMVNSNSRKVTGDLNSWKLEQESINTINNYKGILSSHSLQGANAVDLIELAQSIGKIEAESSQKGNLILGKQNANFTQDTVKETISGYLLNQTLEDPAFAEKQLSDPLISKYMQGEEKVALLEKIRRVGDSNRKQQELNFNIKQDDNETEMNSSVIKNDAMTIPQKIEALRLAEVEGKISSEYANIAEAYLESAEAVDGITDAQTLHSTLKSMINFSFAKYEQNKGQKSSKEFLNEIRKARVQILEEGKKGKLNPKTVNSLLSMLDNKDSLKHIYSALNKVSGGSRFAVGTLYDDTEHALSAFEDAFPNNERDQFLATSMFFDRMMEIVEDENRGNRGVTPQERDAIVGKIKDQISSGKRQGLLFKLNTEPKKEGNFIKIVTTNSGKKIGKTKDGEFVEIK